MRISDWSSDVCSSDLPLSLAGKVETFAMTVIPAAARGRTFRVPLIFSAVAAIALLAAGCAQQPIRPIPYEQADTASWFSGSADYEMDDSYKADYEEGRAAYDELGRASGWGRGWKKV